jgi:hypothetical protein
VPDRHRERADEAGDEVRAVRQVGVEQHLGVGGGTALFQYVGGAVWVMCAGLGVLAYLGMRSGVRDLTG